MKLNFEKLETPQSIFEVIIHTMEGDGDYYPTLEFQVDSKEINNVIHKLEALSEIDSSKYRKLFPEYPYGTYSDDYCTFEGSTIYYYNAAGIKSKVTYELSDADKKEIEKITEEL